MVDRSDITLIGSYWPDSKERQDNLLAFLTHWQDVGVNVKLMTTNLPRTTAINHLLSTVTTKYVGVADVDGILPVEALDEALTALDAGADVVYPYDQIRQGDDWWNDKYIYGILVLFNTDRYRQMGGENEQFSSWGWEDFERYYRALNHGYSVVRLNRVIEHLAHPHNRSDATQRRHNYRLMLAEKHKYESQCSSSINRTAE